MSNTKGREVLRGKLYHRRKGNSSWKKRAVTAYCGVNSQEQNSKTPCSQILLYEDYEKVEKPGQKPKNTIKLEEAKIDSSYSNPSAYSSTISSPHGGVRVSVSPSGYSSGGSGSGVVGSGSGSGTVSTSLHLFSVTTKSGEMHEFRTDTENERLRWVKLLQLLVMFPRSSIPEEPKTNPIKDTFRLRLEAVQYGANSVWPVYILPDEVGLRCDIIGTNVLALKSGVQGKQVGTLNIYNPADPTTPLVSWDRDKMRRTGKTGSLVFIEIGRRCTGGPGLVWMYSGFNDAQALRETLHNFLFKGDGSAVAIPTQQSALYDAPRASFDSNFPPSYQRENSFGSVTNPILSRSRSNDHDSGFVGSPMGSSYTSPPKLEGPPVRLDKHPSIRRKRDASKPREIQRNNSINSPMGSFSETSVRSGDSVEPIFEQDGSSSPHDAQSRSHSPQDDCDGDVVGSMDPDSEHCTANVPMYDVVSPHPGNQSHRVVMNGHSAEYEMMIHPRSSVGIDMQGGYVQMSRALQPVSQTAVTQSTSQSVVPQPTSSGEPYNILKHFSSPQSRNNYDQLPTIREAPKAPERGREPPSIYENHPLPQDLKSIGSHVYQPNYQNVELARQDRRGSQNQEQYENVDSNGEQMAACNNSNGNNSARRMSLRRKDSEREDVRLPVKGNGPSINGVEVTNSPPKSENNGYVQFQPRDSPVGNQFVPGMTPVEYTKINHQETAVVGAMREQRAAGTQQRVLRSEC